jgi:hypothetical protein
MAMPGRNSKIQKLPFAERLSKLTRKQVALLFTLVGLAVFAVGLTGSFQGDDNQQILESVPVHSISHIGTLFSSSTFFNGQQLVGSYYRPMMTTAFALIYSVSGPHPFLFHLVQLVLYMAAAFLLFLVLRNFFANGLSIALALVFLVHPLNSQVVFAIPSMQDVLFFFFGILGIWILINRESTKSLWLVAALTLLSLMSKEVGLVFVLMDIIYLRLFDKKRFKMMSAIFVLPIVLYLLLKTHAIGLFTGRTNIAAIDHLNFSQRLLNMPSLIQFYITKFFLPWKLATRYYWTYSTFSFSHFVVPILVDLIAIGTFAFMGIKVRSNNKPVFKVFVFFTIWAVIGLLPYLQFVPLDMTACANWFYFSMAGVLGMIGAFISSIRLTSNPSWKYAVIAGVLIIGASTIVQGTYYSSSYKLAKHDLANSKEDYAAYGEVAKGLIDEGDYAGAVGYARRSVELQPTLFNYQNLGVALQNTGDYAGAIQAYEAATKYGSQATLYENLGLLALESDNSAKSDQIFQQSITAYPNDFKLWLFYALFQDSQGNNNQAQTSITNAQKYGQVPQQLFEAIMHNQPFTLPLPNSSKVIVVH